MTLPVEFCCERIKQGLTNVCYEHPNRFDRPDKAFDNSPNLDRYGLIIHHGGGAVVRIAYCPFCGAKLRDVADRLFAELDSLDQEWEWETVPEKYRTAEAWRERGL